jgi:hypothetical protein
MTKKLSIPFTKDETRGIYTIKVAKELWPHFTELLIEAGKLKDAEVLFEETT